MSAAHCKPKILEKDGIDWVFGYRVLMGSTTLNEKMDDSFLHKINKRSIRTHPRYEKFSKAYLPPFWPTLSKKRDMGCIINDFMIFSLMKPVNYPTHYFARLPPKDMDDEALKGQSLIASGWGNTVPLTEKDVRDINDGKAVDPRVYPKDLMQTDVNYLSKRLCQKRYKKYLNTHRKVKGRDIKGLRYHDHHVLGDVTFENELGDSMMCTSYCDEENVDNCKTLAKQGTCKGDSGCKLYRSEVYLLSFYLY